MYYHHPDLYNYILKTMPVVCVDVVIVYDREALLIKRKEEPEKGKWWIPGGSLLRDERLADAALRKAKEETGLICRNPVRINDTSLFFEEKHSIDFCYLVEATSNNVKLDNTSSDYKWVDYECVLKLPLHPYVAECLKIYFEGKNANNNNDK